MYTPTTTYQACIQLSKWGLFSQMQKSPYLTRKIGGGVQWKPSGNRQPSPPPPTLSNPEPLVVPLKKNPPCPPSNTRTPMHSQPHLCVFPVCVWCQSRKPWGFVASDQAWYHHNGKMSHYHKWLVSSSHPCVSSFCNVQYHSDPFCFGAWLLLDIIPLNPSTETSWYTPTKRLQPLIPKSHYPPGNHHVSHFWKCPISRS